jgi:hypothetical protein
MVMKNLYPESLTRTIFFLITCCSIRQAAAQSYYPGGLGNSNLVFWLDANNSSSITQNGSNQVSQWSDRSGNGYNFKQSTSGNMPVYGATAGPNSRPALTFTSTSAQYLSLASLPAVSFTGGTSAFVQASFNASQTSYGWERIFDLGNGQSSNNITFGRYGSSANFYYEGFNGSSGDQTYTTSNPIVNGTSNIYEAVHQGGTAGTLTSVAHYRAGTTLSDNGAAGSSSAYVHAAITRTSNYVGRSNWSVDNYLSGTISEILLYNTAFNTTQRVIMENYLWAKWGKSVSVSKYTPPSSTTYNTNLVGIGYTSATDNFLTNPSGSTDGLGFSSGTGSSDFLNTAGYLMAAHNGQSNTDIAPATIPGITAPSGYYLHRWNRSWDINKTNGNSTGLVTLTFNSMDYNGTTPSAANTFMLLYNATDGTFATGINRQVTLASTPTVSGNTVSFVVNATNLTNGYYTIMYTSMILPIVLTEFTATRQESNGLVKWSVAQESNIDHYEIQHGGNDHDLVTVGTVAARNTGGLPGQYSFTDVAPEAGMNYYRLKTVDRDGISTYSIVVPVDFPSGGSAAMRVYPNPVVDRLHIALPGLTGTVSILIIDMQGKVVRTMRSAASNMIDIPVGDLSKGIYGIEVNTGVGKYVQKIIKN